MFDLYGFDLFASGLFWLVLLLIAGGVSAWTRLVWPAGVIVTLAALVLLGPEVLFGIPLVLLLLFPLIGTAAGVTGVAIRYGYLRLGALGGTWLGAGLALFHLLILSTVTHSTEDLIMGVGLLITFLVLGPFTVLVLPPDEETPERNEG